MRIYFSELSIRTILIAIYFLLASLSSASSAVLIPNADILGRNINSATNILMPYTGSGNIYPKEVRLTIANDVVDEIQVFYSKDVSIGQIETVVNVYYKKWEKAEFIGVMDIHIWKIPEKTFIIQLSKFKDDTQPELNGDSLLIFTRMKQTSL